MQKTTSTPTERILILAICIGLLGISANAKGAAPAAKMLQYTAAGHVLGFGPGKVWVASRNHSLQIELVGSRSVLPVSQGNAQAKQNDKVQPMQKVVYAEAWPGVTVEYDTAAGAIAKSTYRISAGQKGNPVRQIRLRYNRPVRLDAAGNLLIRFQQGELREAAPTAWQMQGNIKKTVKVRFKPLSNYEVGFEAEYDPRYALVIDPALNWNTFLGDSGDDYGCSIAIDGSGNVYVAGISSATWGSPVRAYSAGDDAFVAKLDSSGSLVWNTFLGGSMTDGATSIVVDGSGNVYVGGNSAATWGSPVRAYSSSDDAFVAKLNSSGNLMWNTFLGGSGSDFIQSIAMDGSGDVYVGGYGGFTWGSPVRAHSTGYDGFTAKLNSSGNLMWNTFLGGDGSDSIQSIAVDGSGDVYVGGYSAATWESPVRAYSSGYDGFTAKLNSSGNLIWNTFLGGSGYDWGESIAVDGSGNVYVGGFSAATWGSPVRAFGSAHDAFVAKLNSSGNLIWNTFLGGSSGDRGESIAVDGSGNVYVGGNSSATWGSPDRAYNSNYDAFVAKMDNSGNLMSNTFLGGSGLDWDHSMVVDGSGNVYVVGYSDVTWGSPVRAYTGLNDMFVAKLCMPQQVGSITPYYRLTTSSFKLSVRGGYLTGTSSLRLQNPKTGQSIAGTDLDVASNALSAQFSASGISGLYDLILSKSGLEFVFKSLFTLIVPKSGSTRWQMNQLAKVGSNPGSAGSVVIADANRDHEAEVFAAYGGQNLACLKKSGTVWAVSSFLESAGESFRQLLAMDGNGDGEQELYAAGASPQLCQYAWGESSPSSVLGAEGAPLATGDGNSDGLREIYAASGNTTTGQGLNVWRYQANTWTNSTVKAITSGVAFTSLVAGDGNHDDADELYAAYQDGSNNHYFYQYKYSAGSWNATGIANPGSGAIKSLALADINSNGQNELYVASADGKVYQLVHANPGWSSTTINSSNFVVCNQIAISDGDNDGQDEVYAAGADGHAWQFKLASGAWQATDLGYSGTTLTAIAVGDGDNNFQFEVYALGADGYVYQFQDVAYVPTATPTPQPTATPMAAVPGGFGGQIIDKNFFYVAPNPARGGIAHFRFFLRQSAEVEIRIYTPQGSPVLTKAYRFYPQGWNTIDWNAAGMANGVYFYVVEAKANGICEKTKVKNLILMK